jgi:hypothetical protein
VVSEEDHNAAEDNDEQKMCMVEVGHQDEGDDPDEVEADHQNKGDELHSRHQYGQECRKKSFDNENRYVGAIV